LEGTQEASIESEVVQEGIEFFKGTRATTGASKKK